MTPSALKEYRRQRALGWSAQHALSHAKSYDRFVELERAGLARLDIQPDDCPDMSWAGQDCFKHDRAKIYARANQHGIWGVVAQVRASEDDEWETVDSCWGFIGDEWRDSGYDIDHYQACVDWHDTRATEIARELEESRPDMYQIARA